MGALSIGVLGGTFDPIHIAHLVLGQEALWQLGLDRVLLVPAGQPWRKEERRVSEFAKRAEMARLAALGNERLEVSMLEGERPGPSYIVDTLAQLKELYADSRLLLVLGQDALADLPNWKDPARIKKLARLAVARRAGSSLSGEAREQSGDHALIDMPRMDISSTMIRERIRLGRPWELFVPPNVASFIHRERLYVV
jgi:nicotinate-nucleotide adenylyltransferase